MRTSLFLFVLFIFLSPLAAQEPLSQSTKKSLLFDTPQDRWSFGLRIQNGVTWTDVDQVRERYMQMQYHTLGLGLFTDYQINRFWSLRLEAGLAMHYDLNSYVTLQQQFALSPRLHFFVGMGVQIDHHAGRLIQRDRHGRAMLNPYLQFGLRYEIAKRWSVDLRYEQEVRDRLRAADAQDYTRIGPLNGLLLGVNYRF